MEPTTLFTLEMRNSTYFIDYTDESGIYTVYKDEKFRCLRHTFGEALEYIFNKVGNVNFKAIYK